MAKDVRKLYGWDVFISYTHTGNVATWVRDYFHPELRDWIKNEIGLRDPRIFVDRFDIRTGEEWERKLGIALRSSICLVPVLTAEYFRSRWCRTEWKTFIAREQQLRRSSNDAGGLIFPVKFSDGEHYDKSALKKQIFDFSPWAYAAPAFKNSAEYPGFERAVKSFVSAFSHARGVLRVPPAPGTSRVAVETKDYQPPRMPVPRYRG